MSVKDINIKNRTYYFFNNIISINDFDPNNFRIDEKSCKNILFLPNWVCYEQKRPKHLSCRS